MTAAPGDERESSAEAESETSHESGSWAFAVDALLVVAYALAAGAAVYAGAVAGAARVLVAAPLLGFLPGYALVSVLFPERDEFDGRVLTTERLRRPGVAWAERCAFSFAASVALLPILALAIDAAGRPLSLRAFLAVLVGVVVVGSVLGVGRRLGLPAEERYAPPLGRWRREARAGLFETDSPFDAALNVALALAVVAAMSGFAYGLAAPQRGESYTEAALLTREGGDLVAANYSTTLVRGDPANVTLTVENQEGEAVDYTAVVVVERLRTSGGEPVVLERRELRRLSFRVADTRTHVEDLSLRPQLLGEDLRVSVLLFHGDAPETATPARADEHLFLWVDVRVAGGNAAGVVAAPRAARAPTSTRLAGGA